MNNLSKPRINYTKPSITRLEVEYATDAARNGWGNNCYDYSHFLANCEHVCSTNLQYLKFSHG